MKRLLTVVLILFLWTNHILAQLEVNDTLLMASNNNVFWSSSSELEGYDDTNEFDMGGYADFGKYGSMKLGDSDPKTCWAEGKKNDGSGEYIWMTIAKNTATIQVRNGYQKNENIYYANNRPKNIELELFACYEPSGYVTESHNGFFMSEPIATSSALLEDKLGYQDIKMAFDWHNINSRLSNDEIFDEDQFILKIKIVDVYKGTKWDDACISDINAIPNPNYDITSDDHGLLKIWDNKTDTLFYTEDKVYQVVELSNDLKWIIFILMPSDIENSRVDTVYKLYNTDREQFVIPDDLVLLTGFIKRSNKLHIKGSNKDFEDKIIPLDNL